MKLENVQIFMEQLDQFQTILNDWIPKNASIAVAAEGKYIYFSASSHHIHLNIGEEVHPESVAAIVLNNRKKTDTILDESILGVAYYAIGYPILINDLHAALIIILPSTYNVKREQKKEPYKFLTGKQNEDWTPISIDQISHIESLQKKTWFYANSEQYKTKITLKELETRLPEYFVRIHRSYILNIYFIEKIKRDLTSNYIVKLKNNLTLPVSNSYINNLRKILEF